MITLKTLPDGTAQQVFDQAVNHLRKQGRKAERPATEDERKQYAKDTICMYRGPEGTQCAAGCFISDAEYKPEMEGKSWRGKIMADFAGTTEHQLLIGNLQNAHDSLPVIDWEERFQYIAMQHILIYKPI